MKSIALQMLAEINPDTPEFDSLPGEAEVSFTPLETVWADNRADFGRKVAKSTVVSGYTRFRRGDVLCPKVTPTFQAGRSMIAREVGAGTTELHVLRPRPDVDGRFVCYAVRSKGFLDEGVTAFQGVAGLQRVPSEFIRSFKVVDCDAQEQQRIADFLDDRVSGIDNIISARRLQLTDLRTRLRSIVDLVTFEAFSDFGTRLKRLYDVIDERAGDQELQLLSVSIHRGVVPRSTMTPDEARAENLSNYKVSRPGDIVLNRMRAFQGAIGVNRVLGIVSPDYLVLQPKSMVRADWLHYVFRSSWFVGEMIARIRGIGSVELGSVRTPRINAPDLGEIRLSIPDLHEQGVAVDRLAAVQESTESAVDALERSITLLAEYKQSLITSAVTGKLDVTAASKAISV